MYNLKYVLILVVVDDGLVHINDYEYPYNHVNVLILVVVDDGLVRGRKFAIHKVEDGLNPCCSGRWSRTRPYKTLLIINKLKNFTKQIFTFLNRKLTIS